MDPLVIGCLRPFFCLELVNEFANVLRACAGDDHHGVGGADHHQVIDADDSRQTIVGMHDATLCIHRHDRALQDIAGSVARM